MQEVTVAVSFHINTGQPGWHHASLSLTHSNTKTLTQLSLHIHRGIVTLEKSPPTPYVLKESLEAFLSTMQWGFSESIKAANIFLKFSKYSSTHIQCKIFICTSPPFPKTLLITYIIISYLHHPVKSTVLGSNRKNPIRSINLPRSKPRGSIDSIILNDCNTQSSLRGVWVRGMCPESPRVEFPEALWAKNSALVMGATKLQPWGL